MRPPESAPYLHVASFALTADSGQFGAGATATMGPDGAFAALVEYLIDRHAQPGVGPVRVAALAAAPARR